MINRHFHRSTGAFLVAAVMASSFAHAQAGGSDSAAAPDTTAAAPSIETLLDSSGSGDGDFDQPGALRDRSPHVRKQMLTIWAFLPYAYGLGIGVGARYTIPIVPDGFIEALNDSIELEFGADIAYSNFFGFSSVQLIIPVEARWTFHFTPKWEAYGKIGIGLLLDFGAYNYLGLTNGGTYVTVTPEISVGGLYRINETLYLRGELGYGGLKFGLGFAF